MQPGTIIDERFVIEESIERGGFGQVYRAYDMQEEIVVAVKVVRTKVKISSNSRLITIQPCFVSKKLNN